MKLTRKKNYEAGDVVLVSERQSFEPTTIVEVVPRDGNAEDEFYLVDEGEYFVQHSQIAGCLDGWMPPVKPWDNPASDERITTAVVGEVQEPCDGQPLGGAGIPTTTGPVKEDLVPSVLAPDEKKEQE